jgi:hypothetical protein
MAPSSNDRFAALENELRSEQASTLGRLGRAVEDALHVLRIAPASTRARLVEEAAYVVWSYFVFREALGMHRHEHAIEVYAIPDEVLARVGAVRR